MMNLLVDHVSNNELNQISLDIVHRRMNRWGSVKSSNLHADTINSEGITMNRWRLGMMERVDGIVIGVLVGVDVVAPQYSLDNNLKLPNSHA